MIIHVLAATPELLGVVFKVPGGEAATSPCCLGPGAQGAAAQLHSKAADVVFKAPCVLGPNGIGSWGLPVAISTGTLET